MEKSPSGNGSLDGEVSEDMQFWKQKKPESPKAAVLLGFVHPLERLKQFDVWRGIYVFLHTEFSIFPLREATPEPPSVNTSADLSFLVRKMISRKSNG